MLGSIGLISLSSFGGDHLLTELDFWDNSLTLCMPLYLAFSVLHYFTYLGLVSHLYGVLRIGFEVLSPVQVDNNAQRRDSTIQTLIRSYYNWHDYIQLTIIKPQQWYGVE